MKYLTILALFAITISASQSLPDPVALMNEVDANTFSKNKVYESEMTIYTKRGTRVVKSKSYVEGTTKSFVEYLSPAREKGTKMLKLDDKLWIYSPSTDRTIQIAGHMLRQSVMGSDMSYEDMMDDRKLLDIYTPSVEGEETVNGFECYRVKLLAKVDNAAYHSQKMWIHKEKKVVLKQELYSKSGQLLKKVEMSDIKQFGDRWFATKGNYKDMLKNGKGTEFKMSNLEFDADIPPYIFSKGALKK